MKARDFISPLLILFVFYVFWESDPWFVMLWAISDYFASSFICYYISYRPSSQTLFQEYNINKITVLNVFAISFHLFIIFPLGILFICGIFFSLDPILKNTTFEQFFHIVSIGLLDVTPNKDNIDFLNAYNYTDHIILIITSIVSKLRWLHDSDNKYSKTIVNANIGELYLVELFIIFIASYFLTYFNLNDQTIYIAMLLIIYTKEQFANFVLSEKFKKRSSDH